jgi:pimeloyl-ACP methyl ester carboxylesterase
MTVWSAIRALVPRDAPCGAEAFEATTVNFAAVTTPVLLIRGECALLIPPQVAPWTAARYQRGTYVEVPRFDHLVFCGEALPVTMGHIDYWMARNHVLATA